MLNKNNFKLLFTIIALANLSACSVMDKKLKNTAIEDEFKQETTLETKPYPLTEVKNPENFVKFYLKSKISINNSTSIKKVADNLYKLALENTSDVELQEQAFLVLLASRQYAKALTIKNNKNLGDEQLTFERLMDYNTALIQSRTNAAKLILEKLNAEQSGLNFLKIITAYFNYEKHNNIDELATEIFDIKSSMALEGFKYYYLARAYEAKDDYETAFKLYFAAFKKFGLKTEDVFARMYYSSKQINEGPLKNSISSDSKYGKNIYLIDQAFINTTNVKKLNNSIKNISAQIFYDLGWSITQTSAGLAGLDFLALADYIVPSDKIKYQMAKGYTENKWDDSAIDLLKQINKDDLYYISAQVTIADKIQKDDYKQAIDIITNLQNEYNFNKNYSAGIIGQIYLNNNMFNKAIESFTTALETEKTGKNYFSRAIAYEQSGKVEKALSDLKISIEKNPSNPIVLNYIGYILIDIKHEYEEGIEYIKQAIKLDPTNSASIDSLGWAYLQNKEYKKGLEILENAYAIKPFDGVITGHLGDAYLHNNRKNEAIIYWKKALKLGIEDNREEKRIKNKLYKYNK